LFVCLALCLLPFSLSFGRPLLRRCGFSVRCLCFYRRPRPAPVYSIGARASIRVHLRVFGRFGVCVYVCLRAGSDVGGVKAALAAKAGLAEDDPIIGRLEWLGYSRGTPGVLHSRGTLGYSRGNPLEGYSRGTLLQGYSRGTPGVLHSRGTPGVLHSRGTPGVLMGYSTQGVLQGYSTRGVLQGYSWGTPL
jgi:hypothetical protein